MSLAFAVGASASVVSDGGFKYVTKQFTLKPGDPKTTRAACPKRTHVLGGGHWNVGGYSDVVGAHSFPYDSDDRDHQPDDGWAAQLRAFGQSYTATIHAICGKTFPGYEQRQVSVTADSLSQDFSLKCDPTSLRATQGGSRGPASIRETKGVVTSLRNAWFQGLVNHGASAGSVTIYAICTHLDTKRFDYPSVTAQAGLQTLASGACPDSHPQVVGGGAFTNAASTFVLGDSAIAATRPFTGEPMRWDVWIDNYNLNPIQLTPSAICVPEQ